MSAGIGSPLFSNSSGRIWIESVLPSAWAELCTGLGARSGVVVLKSADEDSFYENSSFGYGEDGFFYSFLSRGGKDWERLMSSPEPVVFSGREYEIFHSQGIAKAVRILSGEESIGFILMEWEEESGGEEDIFLYLFSEKIGKEWHPKSKIATAFSETKTPSGGAPPFLLPSLPHYHSRLESLSREKVITIIGPSGSGKKTLAKWIHNQIRPQTPFLVLGSLPENFGKLEKSLSDWGKEAGQGSLVFLNSKSLSLGQQKIIVDWMGEGSFSGLVFFLDRPEEKEEILPEYSKILQKNQLLLPSFDFLSREVLSEITVQLFRDLVLSQNRNGLELEHSALQSILNRSFPGNFSDLKNLLLSAILTCKGNEVGLEDLEEEISSVDLGVPDAEDLDLRRGIQALERQKILLSMRIFSGNQIRMAKALGISRGSLQYKMKQLGLL
ncbi:response regulator [Leptospira idonii]|uniref:Response regulator n=2 Tax=Leptospira idonii TaxID=1193500 RepID=A0A4R9LZD3_9LEPT|nr:response regulator [Leptospira idonii]